MVKLFSLYYDVYVKSEKHMQMGCGLIAAIATFSNTTFIEQKSKYWELYVKAIISSKTLPPAAVLVSGQKSTGYATHKNKA